MASSRFRLLGEILVEAQVVNPDQLQQALAFQDQAGVRLGEALRAASADSRSRISPISSTSGACRRAARRAWWKEGVSVATSRWLTRLRLSGCRNSMGSSRVMTWAVRRWLIRSTIAARVVYFAETGHLVLSTLHSINAAQALERLLAFFPPDHTQETLHRLSIILEGIMPQRLVPRADGGGRVAALEILVATPRVRELLRRRDLGSIKQAIQAGGQEGMQTFDQSLYDLYRRGLVSLEEALRHADSANDLRLRIKGLSGT